jgi:hypothetical protein
MCRRKLRRGGEKGNGSEKMGGGEGGGKRNIKGVERKGCRKMGIRKEE